MKKHLKKFLSAFFALMLVGISFFTVTADSYIVIDGFSFLGTSSGGCIIYSYDQHKTDVVIPNELAGNSVEEIADYAFLDNVNMTSINFSQARRLYKLGASSFAKCTSLTEVVIPTRIQRISQSTFQSCTSLSKVTIYGNLPEIPVQAFYNCSSLHNVVLPQSVKTIGNNAFGKCTSLTSIFIPTGVSNISDSAFRNCPNLTIRGYYGSYAEKYAARMKIKFDGIATHKLGDVDLDGRVNIRDATAIQSHIASIDVLYGESLALADYNGDGSVNIMDATAIQKMIAEII